MTTSPILRWFWRLYMPVAVAVLLGFPAVALGPSVESSLFPVRADQRISGVTRTADRLCWIWSSLKLRALISDDMDVYLDTADDHMVVSVFERDTMMPWGKSRAVGIGRHDQPYCVQLPPHIKPTERITVRQRAWYPGFLGLWRLALYFPDIVDPPDATPP